MSISEILSALERRERVAAPVLMIVAHPDDETIGAGGSMCLFDDLAVLHVTDGAPLDKADANAAGFPTVTGYARARRRELKAAMAASGGTPKLPPYETLSDQEAADYLLELTLSFALEAANYTAILTHAYEGGHPDHDSIAFAVQQTGAPTIEMAGYHAGPEGGMLVGRFLGADQGVASPLDVEDGARRDTMLRCFKTQERTLAPFFGQTEERFRAAPRYDFNRPPAARVLYDGYGWPMTGARWCALAGKALQSSPS